MNHRNFVPVAQLNEFGVCINANKITEEICKCKFVIKVAQCDGKIGVSSDACVNYGDYEGYGSPIGKSEYFNDFIYDNVDEAIAKEAQRIYRFFERKKVKQDVLNLVMTYFRRQPVQLELF